METTQVMLGVRLRLRPTSEGGRALPLVYDGWGQMRPNWSRGEANPQRSSGAAVLALHPAIVSPSESARTVLGVLHEHDWAGVTAGEQLFMFEGTRLRGDAEVRAVWTVPNYLDEEVRSRAQAWVREA